LCFRFVLEDFIGSRFVVQFGVFTPHSDKSNIHTYTSHDDLM